MAMCQSWLYASVMVLCTRHGSMYQAWFYASVMALCTRHGSMYQAWFYVPVMVLCIRHGSIYQKWLYVPGMVLCTRHGSMYQAWLCTRHGSMHQAWHYVHQLILHNPAKYLVLDKSNMQHFGVGSYGKTLSSCVDVRSSLVDKSYVLVSDKSSRHQHRSYLSYVPDMEYRVYGDSGLPFAPHHLWSVCIPEGVTTQAHLELIQPVWQN